MGELITVKSVESKVSRNNKPFIRVQDARNRWLTKWGSDAPTVGQVYMAEVRSEQRDGSTFHTIDSWQPHQVGSAANGAAPSPESGRERRIQAECALKAAVETARSLPITDPSPIALQALILDWADRYLTWLLANDGSTRATDEPF